MNVGAVDPHAASQDGRAGLRRVAGGFEAVFLGLLMKSMRRTVSAGPLFSGGQGGAIFTQMMDAALSDLAVRRGGTLGVASLILERYGRASEPGAPSPGTRLDLRAGA